MRGGTSALHLALLSLLHALGEELGVIGSVVTLLGSALLLESKTVTFALENEGSNQALDLGSLGDSLAVLSGDWATDNVLPDIIVLGEVKQATDLAGTFGPKTTGDGVVGKARNFLLTLLDDGQVEYAELSIDDTSTDRFPLALSATTGAVAAVSLGQKKTHTGVGKDTLFHGESLLVVSSSNAQTVTLPFITKLISSYLSSNTFVVEDAELALIVLLDQLLAARCRE